MSGIHTNQTKPNQKIMKLRFVFPSIVVTSVLIAAQASAAVLFSLPGSQTVVNGEPSLVNTTNDAGDWITAGANNYSDNTSTTPLYMQFTMRVDNNNGESGGGGFFTAFNLRKTTAERLAVGNTWGSLNWGGFGGGGGDFNINGASAYAVGTPATFVLKIDQAAGSATIWFNPDTAVAEASQPAGITTVRTGQGIALQFDDIWLRAGNNNGSTTFSGITIQNTTVFVPEPGSAVLGALGLLTLLRRRR